MIVLVILGIVAMITVPSMINNYQERNTVVRLKKAYSTLDNAYGLVLVEDGPPSGWNRGLMDEADSHIIIANAFKKHFSVAVDCVGKSLGYTRANCVLGGTIEQSTTAASFVTKDGSTFSFRSWFADCRDYRGIKNACGTITIDTNGIKSPNKDGYDRFVFYITADRIIPSGMSSAPELTFGAGCNKSVSGLDPLFTTQLLATCAAWVIYNENLDYLHCEDLSWEGKKKCK